MPGWTAIEEVYGPVGKGTSQSLYVRASNGSEYMVKGPSLVSNYRHVATNELICAGLAERMGLATLDSRVLTMDGCLFFGRVWMDGSVFHPIMDAELFDGCQNNESVYDLVVFDTWVCNTDRHEGNLIARCGGRRSDARGRHGCTAERHAMLLNDHGDCLLPDNHATSFFESRLSQMGLTDCILLPLVRNAIICAEDLSRAIGLAESITDEDLAAIVQGVPSELLGEEDRPDWVAFLTSRRDGLRAIFAGQRGFFPFLNRGEI